MTSSDYTYSVTFCQSWQLVLTSEFSQLFVPGTGSVEVSEETEQLASPPGQGTRSSTEEPGEETRAAPAMAQDEAPTTVPGDERWQVLAFTIPYPPDGRLGITLQDDKETMACVGHRAMIAAFVLEHGYAAGLRVDDRVHRLNGVALFDLDWNEVRTGPQSRCHPGTPRHAAPPSPPDAASTPAAATADRLPRAHGRETLDDGQAIAAPLRRRPFPSRKTCHASLALALAHCSRLRWTRYHHACLQPMTAAAAAATTTVTAAPDTRPTTTTQWPSLLQVMAEFTKLRSEVRGVETTATHSQKVLCMPLLPPPPLS